MDSISMHGDGNVVEKEQERQGAEWRRRAPGLLRAGCKAVQEDAKSMYRGKSFSRSSLNFLNRNGRSLIKTKSRN